MVGEIRKPDLDAGRGLRLCRCSLYSQRDAAITYKDFVLYDRLRKQRTGVPIFKPDDARDH